MELLWGVLLLEMAESLKHKLRAYTQRQANLKGTIIWSIRAIAINGASLEAEIKFYFFNYSHGQQQLHLSHTFAKGEFQLSLRVGESSLNVWIIVL